MVRTTHCLRSIHILDLEANSGVSQQLHLPLNAEGKLPGSFNGLLCIYFESENTLVLWNPLIKEHLSVQDPSLWELDLEFVGFGYDGSSDDFKL